jgi:hypothetical protein
VTAIVETTVKQQKIGESEARRPILTKLDDPREKAKAVQSEALAPNSWSLKA